MRDCFVWSETGTSLSEDADDGRHFTSSHKYSCKRIFITACQAEMNCEYGIQIAKILCQESWSLCQKMDYLAETVPLLLENTGKW